MSKFVELNEAAKLLGITPDELIELRAEGKIHGYRDGSSWKFKNDEVDRVLAERGGGGDLELAAEGGSDLSLGSSSDLALGDEGSGIDSDVTLVPGGGDSDVALATM